MAAGMMAGAAATTGVDKLWNGFRIGKRMATILAAIGQFFGAGMGISRLANGPRRDLLDRPRSALVTKLITLVVGSLSAFHKLMTH